MLKNTHKNTGRYGQFGGYYMPEGLMSPIQELAQAFECEYAKKSFRDTLDTILKNYAGRPTPLTEAIHFSDAIQGPRIFLKREDLLHTGAHKLNTALGQCLLAKHMNKSRIIA